MDDDYTRQCNLVDSVKSHLGDNATDEDMIDFIERAVNKAIVEEKADKVQRSKGRWRP